MNTVPRRLRAPREDGGVLIDPPGRALSAILRANHSARAAYDYDVQGRSLTQLADGARAELLACAHRYTQAYRDVAVPRQPSKVLAAGHQPSLFHPGVWAKNFALGRWSAEHNAVGVNLIVDSDTLKSAEIVVPAGSPAAPGKAKVAFDAAGAELPWEERVVQDTAFADRFANRVRETLGPLVSDPLIESYWPRVLAGTNAGLPWGAALARARHQLEGEWGLATLEIPQSQVCELPAFWWFAAHLLARAGAFQGAHNEAVASYRRAHRLRSANHPFPNLASDGAWIEAPFWVWSAEDPRRRRLFCQTSAGEIQVTDRAGWQASLPLSADGDAARAVDVLSDWRRQGIKLRTRALTTTLFARLLLCDVFIHGLGGGKYDAVTDDVMRAFFGVEPPRHVTVTATLHLPLATADEINAQESIDGTREVIEATFRQLRYHPERYLSLAAGLSEDETMAAGRIAAEKRRWVETEPQRGTARKRCHAIRAANEALQRYLASVREKLERRRVLAAAAEQVAAVRHDREYAFCLYPEEKLRNFLLEIGQDSG